MSPDSECYITHSGINNFIVPFPTYILLGRLCISWKSWLKPSILCEGIPSAQEENWQFNAHINTCQRSNILRTLNVGMRQRYGSVLLVTFLLQRNLCRYCSIMCVPEFFLVHGIIFCSIGLVFCFYMKVVSRYNIFFKCSHNPSATTRRMGPCFIHYKYINLLSMLWALLFVFV